MSGRSPTSSRGNDVTAQLLVLEYNGRQTLVPRPRGYQDLLRSLRRYFPDIPNDHDDFVFETNEAAICRGKWVVVSEDAWETVVPLVQTVKVVSSARIQPSWPFPFSLFQGVAAVLRYWEDSDPYHIFIDNGTGRTVRVSCSSSDTVGSVKKLFQGEEGLHPGMQTYYYDLQELKNDRTLAEYGVRTGATIRLVDYMPTGKKPVIYIYPPVATRVSTKLSLVPEWEFSAIYPVVPAKTTPQGQALEWVVDASPNGILKDVNTGLEVSYLYWEAETNIHNLLSPPASPSLSPTGTATETFVPNRGTLSTTNSVVLKVEKITTYLDSSLKALGLHVEARTSFITYWLPSILKHKYIALRFLPQSAYERAAPLHLEPSPDVVGRIFMLFRGVSENDLEAWVEARERTKDAVEFWKDVVGVDVDKIGDASLFRVIEWGGMEVR
ncbi:hypothetical protein EST38_g13960 [Candolleomyces aberdarensis]|uniref:Ubiquitin-like domain-containing protein n=1 Tax=Candolleomyces aberdarensis TaxID=2316362 RepID=A0A4Q2D0X7_9AGAR|nr:hypothetical protein EST38_g13960 [Candolleomyces aberdarensis]